MSGEGIAAIIASLATLVGVAGNVVLQLKQLKLSNANSDKLDAQGGKIDEVHAATTTLVEATGTHKVLPSGE
jgi:hypothetical protein